MKPRVAIPVPYSRDPAYVERSLAQYTRAVEESGGEPLVIQLALPPDEMARQLTSCDAVLLPGAPADVDPEKYGAARHPKTEPPDPLRDAADELLLQDAYNMRKPILGICYGLQSLNVWRTGSLKQHIETPVNHAAGRKVAHAHTVEVDPHSKLGKIVEQANNMDAIPQPRSLELPVNSSHHQASEVVGDGLLRFGDGRVLVAKRVRPEPAIDGFLVGLQHVLAQAKAGMQKRLVVFVRGVEVVNQVQQRCPIKDGELGFDIGPGRLRSRLTFRHRRIRR